MPDDSPKKRVFSGVQPTGKIHLGNYIGALSQWVENQTRYNNIFCIVDLHALTIPQAIQPEKLREKIREVAALYLACGVDPEHSVVFIQSQVPAHAELAWILNCVTPMGWLAHMTQYKSKAAQMESVSTGLLDYPVLQAADILLYRTDLVPVGEDQKQHVELTADIARRFNRLFGEALVIPKPLLRADCARIMGFDDPTIKMSKSLGESRSGHAIGLLDRPDTIRETTMGAVTDSGKETRFDQASPAIRNLLMMYEFLSGGTRPEIEAHFEGKGYGYMKRELADLTITRLAPIRDRYRQIVREPTYLDAVLRRGAGLARTIAESTLSQVKELVGLGTPIRKRRKRSRWSTDGEQQQNHLD
ncbi:MAG TPA: tryptophan--tRNA ligase [Candidatus Sulfotelmatobacter sp.]|nr:tryptophan--tRNA ligase [Candidatus Sulfotelmatobacter sp.]